MRCFESRVCKQCLQRGEYFFAGKDANRGMARDPNGAGLLGDESDKCLKMGRVAGCRAVGRGRRVVERAQYHRHCQAQEQ